MERVGDIGRFPIATRRQCTYVPSMMVCVGLRERNHVRAATSGVTLMLHSWHEPNLLKKPHHVFFRPFLDELSVSNPMDGD